MFQSLNLRHCILLFLCLGPCCLCSVAMTPQFEQCSTFLRSHRQLCLVLGASLGAAAHARTLTLPPAFTPQAALPEASLLLVHPYPPPYL
ncbi:hypothetical protein BC567DRAFT_229899 [Phyllosticta citribraziliensis]